MTLTSALLAASWSIKWELFTDWSSYNDLDLCFPGSKLVNKVRAVYSTDWSSYNDLDLCCPGSKLVDKVRAIYWLTFLMTLTSAVLAASWSVRWELYLLTVVLTMTLTSAVLVASWSVRWELFTDYVHDDLDLCCPGSKLVGKVRAIYWLTFLMTLTSAVLAASLSVRWELCYWLTFLQWPWPLLSWQPASR